MCTDTATTEIYPYGHTLSLHDTLPIIVRPAARLPYRNDRGRADARLDQSAADLFPTTSSGGGALAAAARSEEHTSELQSLMRISYAGFGLNNKTQNGITRGGAHVTNSGN